MSLQASMKVLWFVGVVSLVIPVATTNSHAQVWAPSLIPGPVEENSQTNTEAEEILRTFEREAKAAHQEAKKACETLTDNPAKEQCMAKARLQFDADMRYAQKRAQMGN